MKSRRITAFILSMAMIVESVPAMVFAEDDIQEDIQEETQDEAIEETELAGCYLRNGV